MTFTQVQGEISRAMKRNTLSVDASAPDMTR